MVWPTTITTNDDIKKHVWEQGLTDRFPEAGNDFDDLHESVAIEVRLWLESKGGVDNADRIENPTDFAPAASYLFASKALLNRDRDLSKEYRFGFLRRMSSTQPKLSQDPASGGVTAKIVVFNQGDRAFTEKRTGSIFD